MQVLSKTEIEFVSGGFQDISRGKGAAKTPSPSLSRPTPGESEHGRELNDLAGMLTSFGSWIGITLADMVHPAPSLKLRLSEFGGCCTSGRQMG